METEVLLSPQEAADRTGVHLRTIYRWVTRGHLTSTDGKVKLSDVERIQKDLDDSVPKLQLRRDFGVCPATLHSWKRRGVIEIVSPLGVERVLKTSYEKIKATKLGRRVNFHPDYIPVNDLLRVTGLEASKLNEFLDAGVVRSKMTNGRRMIPRKVYEHYKKLMDETMRPTDVERVLQISKEKCQRYRRSGRLREIVVLERVRIACDSVAETPSEKKRLEQFLAERRSGRSHEIVAKAKTDSEKAERFAVRRTKDEAKQNLRRKEERRRLREEGVAEKNRKRLEAERLRAERVEQERQEAEAARIAREEAERAEAERRRRFASMPPITVPSLGGLKVYSVEAAAMRLQIQKSRVMDLSGKDVLRSRFVDGKTYIIASSLEAYERRGMK